MLKEIEQTQDFERIISPENLARLIKLTEEKMITASSARFLIKLKHENKIDNEFLAQTIKEIEENQALKILQKERLKTVKQ